MLIKSEVQYDTFCEKHQDIVPIFHQPWWLEIVCQFGTLQKYVITDESKSVVGIFPIFTKQKGGFSWQTCPPFCLYLGPVLLPFQVWTPLPEELKSINKNWYSLQLIWGNVENSQFWEAAGYQTSTMNTYRIAPQTSKEALLKFCRPTTRNRIYNGQNIYQITEEIKITFFRNIYINHHKVRKIYNEENHSLLEKLIFEANKRGNGLILGAKSDNGQLIGAIFVVWDKQTMWHLVAVKEDNVPNNDSHRLLIWEALNKCITLRLVFDFGGGDIKSIGDFFASFGAEKIPFLRAVRYQNTLLKNAIKLIKNVLYPQHSTFH
jgi:hypothetical protein